MSDTQCTEAIAVSFLQAELLKQGFEVSKPIRDNGIDLIVYQVQTAPFTALPLQVKSYTGAGFIADKRYALKPGILMVYIWYAWDNPRYFLLTYDESVDFLRNIGDALNSKEWNEKGSYSRTGTSTSKLTDKQIEIFEDYENRWSWLRNRLRV